VLASALLSEEKRVARSKNKQKIKRHLHSMRRKRRLKRRKLAAAQSQR